MKPIAISSCLAFAALSLYAADPQATNAAPAHAETLLSTTRTAGIGDSPLVRAAKATNRLNKKPGQVITNETLVHAGGHFTTTAAQAQLSPVAPAATPTLEQTAAEQRHARTQAAATAGRAAKLQEQKKVAAARAAARTAESPEALYDDPPALEGPIQTIKPMTPETLGQPQTTSQPQTRTAPQKPPI
jgi:hypothetical protein